MPVRRFSAILLGTLALNLSWVIAEGGTIEGVVGVRGVGPLDVIGEFATVDLIEVATNEVIRSTETDELGRFRFTSLPPGDHEIIARGGVWGDGLGFVTVQDGETTKTAVILQAPDDAANPSTRCSVKQSAGSATVTCASTGRPTAISLFPPDPERGFPSDEPPILREFLGAKLQSGLAPNDAGMVRICGGSFPNANPGLSGVPAMEFPLTVVTTQTGFGDVNLNGNIDLDVDTIFDLTDQVLTVPLPQAQFEGPFQIDLLIGKALTNLIVPVEPLNERRLFNSPIGFRFTPGSPAPQGDQIRSPAAEEDERTVLYNLVLLKDTQVLPHTPFGIVGGLRLLTRIVISNSAPNEGGGALQFWTQDGTDLEVTIDGVTSNRHEFTVPGASSQTLTLDPGEPGSIQVGWALASGKSLGFSTVFSTFTESSSPPLQTPLEEGEDTLLGEAGIAASGVSAFHVLEVNKTSSGLDTGVAIANPGGAPAFLVLTLKDSQEVEVAQKVLVLDSKGQTARFFSGFFDIELESFSGTLVIASPSDVSVISLKTLNGVQRSSLSSGSD